MINQTSMKQQTCGKNSQKTELNHCTSQEPNGDKTKKNVSVLNVGGKPKKIIQGKPITQSGKD